MIDGIKLLIRRFKEGVRVIVLYRVIIVVLIVPAVLALMAWIYAWYTHDETGWAAKMIDKALDIEKGLTGPSVIGGLLSFLPKWRDRNENGIPDEDESKEGKNVNGNNQRNPTVSGKRP